MTKPVVYDYFANRAELLAALIDREFERGADVIAATMQGLSEIGEGDPDTWRLLLMPPAGAPADLRERIHEVRDAANASVSAATSPSSFSPRA